MVKFVGADGQDRLAVDAPDARAPFTGFPLKRLHGKSVVLHELQHPTVFDRPGAR